MTYSIIGKYLYEHLPTECAFFSTYCIRIPCVSGVGGYANYGLSYFKC